MHDRQAQSKTLRYFLLYFSPPNFLISYITSKFVYFVFINVLHTLPPPYGIIIFRDNYSKPTCGMVRFHFAYP